MIRPVTAEANDLEVNGLACRTRKIHKAQGQRKASASQSPIYRVVKSLKHIHISHMLRESPSSLAPITVRPPGILVKTPQHSKNLETENNGKARTLKC